MFRCCYYILGPGHRGSIRRESLVVVDVIFSILDHWNFLAFYDDGSDKMIEGPVPNILLIILNIDHYRYVAPDKWRTKRYCCKIFANLKEWNTHYSSHYFSNFGLLCKNGGGTVTAILWYYIEVIICSKNKASFVKCELDGEFPWYASNKKNSLKGPLPETQKANLFSVLNVWFI